MKRSLHHKQKFTEMESFAPVSVKVFRLMDIQNQMLTDKHFVKKKFAPIRRSGYAKPRKERRLVRRYTRIMNCENKKLSLSLYNSIIKMAHELTGTSLTKRNDKLIEIVNEKTLIENPQKN